MNTQTPSVCVLILNWNGAKLLEKYLPDLLRYTPSSLAEIIVADNGSTDISLEVLDKFGVRTLSFDTNWGFAEGYNQAISMVDHDYICLLNSDVRVTEHWLEPMVDFLNTHPDTVSVQPTLRWDRHPESFEYAGAQGGYLDIWGYPYCRGRIFETLEKDNGQYSSEPKEVFWTTGACMLVRRSEYVKSGGLEKSFFAHQEEIDLCWRWINAGHRLFVVPESIVYHYGGASLSADNPRKTYLNFRNNLLMLYRNLPEPKRSKVLFIRSLLDTLALIVFLLKGQKGDAKAVHSAWKDFRKMRKSMQVDDSEKTRGYAKLYHRSLLWRYHICREKTFAQLKK